MTSGEVRASLDSCGSPQARQYMRVTKIDRDQFLDDTHLDSPVADTACSAAPTSNLLEGEAVQVSSMPAAKTKPTPFTDSKLLPHLRTCKTCGKAKTYRPIYGQLKASGFMGMVCWACFLEDQRLKAKAKKIAPLKALESYVPRTSYIPDNFDCWGSRI